MDINEKNNGNDTNVGSIENSIEEDIKLLREMKNNCLNRFEYYTDPKAREKAEAIEHILSDYKRVLEINEVLLKENEILKEEKEQAWEKWNNLERGSYETEQKLKQQIKELQKKNDELKKLMAHKNWYTQKLEEDLFENARNYVIKKQKIKDKIEDLKMSGGSDGKDNTENTARELAIEALQDILEESEE